ncbi:MAG: hypothetical protein U0166_17935 [Acidobacteriota bacterium]
MRLLRDTCAFLWMVGDDRQLSRRARAAIVAEDTELHLSSASSWEIATKVRLLASRAWYLLAVPKVGLLVTLPVAIASLALADEPPSFGPFEVQSPDARHVAKVAKDPAGAPTDPRFGWVLTVFEQAPDGKQQKQIWSCPFRYSGYPGGLLSRDGQSFVVIDVWYHEDAAGIDFYHEGKLVKTVKGSEVPFDHAKLTKTASHQLWLKDGGAEYGSSAETDAEGRLHVFTADGKEHLYELATGKHLGRSDGAGE